MTTQPNDGLNYLRDYPKLRRWINQCAGCQRLGHKPELPAKLGMSFAPDNLRKFFPELAVNDVGLCDQCAASIRSRES